MKVAEALEVVDRIKPNAFDARDKVRWLSELDHSVYEEVIRTKEDAPMKPVLDTYQKETDEETGEVQEQPVESEGVGFVPYEYGVSEERELLITSPYTECYITYLAAKIDFYNNDTVGYQNQMIMFNALYEQFTAWYTRNHMPKQENSIRV